MCSSTITGVLAWAGRRRRPMCSAKLPALALTFHKVNLQQTRWWNTAPCAPQNQWPLSEPLVVTDGRLHAVRYKQTFDAYIAGRLPM